MRAPKRSRSGSLGLLLAGHGALRALAGARVGLGALTAHGQTTTVTKTLVGADLDLAADVGLHLTAKVTLEAVVALEEVTKRNELGLTEVLDAGVGVDAGGNQRLLGTGATDTEDVGQCDLDALLARKVDANKTSHVGCSPDFCFAEVWSKHRSGARSPRRRTTAGPRPPCRG